MFWTEIIIGAWIGSLVGMLIIVARIVFSGKGM